MGGGCPESVDEGTITSALNHIHGTHGSHGSRPAQQGTIESNLKFVNHHEKENRKRKLNLNDEVEGQSPDFKKQKTTKPLNQNFQLQPEGEVWLGEVELQ